jgi:glycosidase
MTDPQNPCLFEVNTRLLMAERSKQLGRPATLDDIADSQLRDLKSLGFDWVWLLGTWQTGPLSRSIALRDSPWIAEYRRLIPDLREEDIQASPFSVADYRVHKTYGGDEALARLRSRMSASGLRLMLDFVPNHTGPDHHWVSEHPEFYVSGTPDDLSRAPQNFCRVDTRQGPRILAYGRDPNYSGWSDTLQLNYANPAVGEAMTTELSRIAGQCDGVRCDMAMLLLPDVFERTWGTRPQSFWPQAIEQVRARRGDFIFMAEVYWDLEWTLQQGGFNYTYDKKLYDRLVSQRAVPVREHLRASPDYQRRSVRFLENHDEPRAAAVFPEPIHRAAAILALTSPGMRFVHEGQMEGRRYRIPVQLARRPEEPVSTNLQNFYHKLFETLRSPVLRNGSSQIVNCTAAWDGNWTWECFHCALWSGNSGKPPILTAINYSDYQAQCFVNLPIPDLTGKRVWLRDRMSSVQYGRSGDDIAARGLYLDLPAWGFHVFEILLRMDGLSPISYNPSH